MSYFVEPLSDGRFRYRFTLKLDDHDGTWIPGQGFGWLVFGDGQGGASLLSDFVGDPMSGSVGPWDRFDSTAGYNNGPSLGALRTLWYPVAVGETLTWSGVSRVNLGAGWLRWSVLVTDRRPGPIEGEDAVYETKCGSADITRDGYLDGNDFDAFVAGYDMGASVSDVDLNGFVNSDDWEVFFSAFSLGC